MPPEEAAEKFGTGQDTQGLKSLGENSTYKLSPEGTAESSPGRSPVLGKSQEQSRQGRLRMSQDSSPGRMVSSRVESSAL